MAAMAFLFASALHPALGQDAPPLPAQKPAAKNAEKPTASEKAVNPAQIELLETKVRFEANGDSRKEVHALVKINSELGVRQFARLNFDFNRSFESVDIPLVHITHATGGTADILPSAITDNPNPSVIDAPAYQDVRVKTVRILGLAPGDTLEYRVIKTVSHHPLAPDFWLDHTFDRTGVVSHEIFEIDAPNSSLQIRINPDMPATTTEKSGEGDSARLLDRWDIESASLKPQQNPPTPDVTLTTFSSWAVLATRLSRMGIGNSGFSTLIWLDAMAKIGAPEPVPPKVLYDFVAHKFKTIDLPLDLSGYVKRGVSQILESNYGTEEEKVRLLLVLMLQNPVQPSLILYGHQGFDQELPRPTLLTGSLLALREKATDIFLDPGLEVAPFGLIPADLRGRKALIIGDFTSRKGDCFTEIPRGLPFPAKQKVTIEAAIGVNGELKAGVRYSMRGDNELVLRLAFHQTPKEKLKELAQLLSITDGFRGQVTSVNASDPYATKEPFTLGYEIQQLKFVDWSKKTVRIPALLPQLGLPDPAGTPAPGAATSPIDLGTPLDVQTEMSLQLPPGTTASAPTGTSVERDYATYSSQYSVKGSSITASRHIHFILREIPFARAADYNAFLHAVQSDEAQDFTLEHNPPPAAAKEPLHE